MPNWSDVLREISTTANELERQAENYHMRSRAALDAVRHKYVDELHRYTSRNVIVYYSGFLSKPEVRSDINDEDKNGFMMAVHKMKRIAGLDLILHTPGGSIASTQSIVNYLRQMFDDDIRAIVPQVAMSAGTMIACSCKEVVMGKHSNLGPIDPHLNGIPAYGVIEEFQQAFKEVKADPAKLAIWQPIISQYRPTFLGQCKHAIDWSNRFVTKQLTEVMFAGKTPAEKKAAKEKARRVVKSLANYRGNKTHNRHIHIEECRQIGLNVVALEDDDQLQDLVLTVHHCYMHVLMNSRAYKIIENQLGAALIKNIRLPLPSSQEPGIVE